MIKQLLYIFSFFLIIISPDYLLRNTFANNEFVDDQSHDVGDCCGVNLNKEAIELTRKALIDWDKNAEAMRDSMKMLERSLELEPRQVGPYMNLSVIYCLGGKDCNKAINLLKRGIEKCPHCPDLYVSLGERYANIRNYKQSIVYYKKALEMNYQTSAGFFYNFGNSYLNSGLPNEAIPYYKKALNENPHHYKAWKNLVTTYYRLGDKNSIKTTIDELLKINPPDNIKTWAKEVISQIGSE